VTIVPAGRLLGDGWVVSAQEGACPILSVELGIDVHASKCSCTFT